MSVSAYQPRLILRFLELYGPASRVCKEQKQIAIAEVNYRAWNPTPTPDEDTLISLNYQLAIPRRSLAQADEEMEENEDVVNPNQKSNLNPSQEQKTDQQQISPQTIFE
ncbi:hypothetical protein MKX01_016335 [Papaver californicum]|nr:hypothetical protein MKX01_016335 [Papaver californicum]